MLGICFPNAQIISQNALTIEERLDLFSIACDEYVSALDKWVAPRSDVSMLTAFFPNGFITPIFNRIAFNQLKNDVKQYTGHIKVKRFYFEKIAEIEMRLNPCLTPVKVLD